MQKTDKEGRFLPLWKHTPTSVTRLPEEFKPCILRVAKLLDEGIIGTDQLEAWLDEKTRTQHLLRQAIVQPDPPRHLRGL